MFGVLQVIQGPDRGKTFVVSRKPLTIGRGTENGVRLSDAQVSRVHCQLSWQGDRVLVSDSGSTAGTWINGERLTAPRELQAGDALVVGDTHFDFKWSHDDEKPTTAWSPSTP